MSLAAHRPTLLGCTIALGLALGAGGCSMDEVQFNGGLFDAVGMSDSARAKSSGGEPKMAERAPLVVPPTLDSLPTPTEGEPGSAQLAAIQDPDVKARVTKEELARQQAEYCKVNYEQAMARGDETTALNAAGPLGPCRPSVLNSISIITGDEGE